MPQNNDPCPVERSCHCAVCLRYGGDQPELLVSGGVDGEGVVLSDMWILRVHSWTWKQVECHQVFGGIRSRGIELTALFFDQCTHVSTYQNELGTGQNP